MSFFDSFTMTIGGKAVSSSETIDVINPATEEIVAKAPDCSEKQLDDAVAAARAAFPGWRATPIEERRRAVARIGEVLTEHQADFARLFTLEQGRPLDGAAH